MSKCLASYSDDFKYKEIQEIWEDRSVPAAYILFRNGEKLEFKALIVNSMLQLDISHIEQITEVKHREVVHLLNLIE